MAKGGATLELEQLGYLNLKKNIQKVRDNNNMSAMKGLMKFLFQIKLIAQLKLKSDEHIKTGRLWNSIYVQTPGQKFADKDGNKAQYADDEGENYDAEMKGIGLKHNEGAVGTNVVYSAKIEFDHDSYLYYAMKHADVDSTGKEIAKILLNGIK